MKLEIGKSEFVIAAGLAAEKVHDRLLSYAIKFAEANIEIINNNLSNLQTATSFHISNIATFKVFDYLSEEKVMFVYDIFCGEDGKVHYAECFIKINKWLFEKVKIKVSDDEELEEKEGVINE